LITPRWIVEPNITIDLPDVAVGSVSIDPSEFARGGGLSSIAPGSQSDADRGMSSGTFRADQVEKPAVLASGNNAPLYPESLRQAGIQGTVTATFVIDQSGRVEMETLRFVRSDNPLFDDAVRTALKRMRFVAAETAGHKVRQLVEMPFMFTLKP
jgi:protein TonB